MNAEQLKALAGGMIELGNVLLGVALLVPIFERGIWPPPSLAVVGGVSAAALYFEALDMIGGIRR
jgi:hypothetical protein